MTESTFAQRLAKACDMAPQVPEQGRGRQAHIANIVGVSQEAASRWFNDESMPRRDKVRQLAAYLNVEESWLALGVAPEMDRRQVRIHARNLDGAAMFVRGLMTMSGVACADVEDTDPRANFIDFYAIIDRKQYALRTSFARKDEGSESFAVDVPAEFKDCYILAVVPVTRGWFDVVHVPTEVIDQAKQRRGGDFYLTVERSDSRYTAGGTRLKKITNFGDLS